jgi:hypothetical protein
MTSESAQNIKPKGHLWWFTILACVLLVSTALVDYSLGQGSVPWPTSVVSSFTNSSVCTNMTYYCDFSAGCESTTQVCLGVQYAWVALEDRIKYGDYCQSLPNVSSGCTMFSSAYVCAYGFHVSTDTTCSTVSCWRFIGFTNICY